MLFTMKSKLLQMNNGRRIFGLVFMPSEDVFPTLLKFSSRNNLSASQFVGNGDIKNIDVGVDSFKMDGPKKITMKDPLGIVSLIGSITIENRTKTVIKAQVILNDALGKLFGGSLLSAKVDHKLEMILEESPSYLQDEIASADDPEGKITSGDKSYE